MSNPQAKRIENHLSRLPSNPYTVFQQELPGYPGVKWTSQVNTVACRFVRGEGQVEITIEEFKGGRRHAYTGGLILSKEDARALALAICPELGGGQ